MLHFPAAEQLKARVPSAMILAHAFWSTSASAFPLST